MANTKNMSRQDRKQAKRAARRELAKLYAGMSDAQKKRYRKWEKKGVKAFLASDEAGD